jgi:hypothetical protein
MKMTGENRSIRGKTCPSATLSTTNPTWTDPGSNPGLRDEIPATNRLSHGAALFAGVKVQSSISYDVQNSTYLSFIDLLIAVTNLKLEPPHYFTVCSNVASTNVV